jgi:peptide/nickel transport system permease protein
MLGPFILRRLTQAIPTLFGITLVAFVLMRLSPSDPVSLMVAGASDLSKDDIAAIRQSYGLDQPLPFQYVSWLTHVLVGDFGQSFLFKRPVIEMIAAALPNTLLLASVALLMALSIGVPLGVLAAHYRGSALDQLIRVFGVAGHAIPGFWFALLFILVLSVNFRVFPVGGMQTIGKGPWDVGDRLSHLIGPALALSLAGIANYSRYMRTEMLEVLGQDFVRTAYSKGLYERRVLFIHALRNALLPLITSLGGLLATLVSGAVVIEQVFAWPGMGRMTYEAARSKDYPVVMAVVLFTSVLLLLSYIIRDIAYGIADPRIRLH